MNNFLKKPKNLSIILLAVIIVITAVGILYFVNKPSPPRVDVQAEIVKYYENSFVGGNLFTFAISEPGTSVLPAGEFGLYAIKPVGNFDVQTDKFGDDSAIEKAKASGNELVSKGDLDAIKGNLLLAAAAFEKRDYAAYLDFSQKAYNLTEELHDQNKFLSDIPFIITSTAVAHAAMFNEKDETATAWIFKALNYREDVSQLFAVSLGLQYKVLSKKYSDAKADYNGLLNQEFSKKIQNVRIPLLIGSGSVCIIEKDFSCAVGRAEELKTINSQRPDVLLYTGTVAALTGDYIQAKVMFEDALKKNPNLALAFYFRGLIEEATGHPADAGYFYQKSLAAARNDFSLYPRDAKVLRGNISTAMQRIGSTAKISNGIVNIIKNIFGSRVVLAEGGDGDVWSFGGHAWLNVGGIWFEINNLMPPTAGGGFDFDLNINFGFGGFAGDYNKSLMAFLTITNPSELFPFDTKLRADATRANTAGISGTVNYSFWWNCQSLSASVSETVLECGALPSPAPGNCSGDPNGFKCNAIDYGSNPADISQETNLHTYTANSVAKVIVEWNVFSVPAFVGVRQAQPLTCVPYLQVTGPDLPVNLVAYGGSNSFPGERPVAVYNDLILGSNGYVFRTADWLPASNSVSGDFPGGNPIDLGGSGILGSDGKIYNVSDWSELSGTFPGTQPVALFYGGSGEYYVLDSSGKVFKYASGSWATFSSATIPGAIDIYRIDTASYTGIYILSSNGTIYRADGTVFIDNFPGGIPISIDRSPMWGGNKAAVLGSDGHVYTAGDPDAGDWRDETIGASDSFPGGMPVDFTGNMVASTLRAHILGFDGKIYEYYNWDDKNDFISGPSYSWSAAPAGNPNFGSGVAFQTQYSSRGSYSVTVENDADNESCFVSIISLPPIADATVSSGDTPSPPYQVGTTVWWGDPIYFFSDKDGDTPPDGNASYDPGGGDLVKYEWDFDSDGTYDWSSTASGNTTGSSSDSAPGTYTATLRVTDNEGDTGEDTVTVTVIPAILHVTCSVDPNKAYLNDKANWRADAFLGTGVYDSFEWSGSAFDLANVQGCKMPIGSHESDNPNEVTECRYWRTGTFEAKVKVTDSVGTIAENTCTIKVASPPPIWIEIAPH